MRSTSAAVRFALSVAFVLGCSSEPPTSDVVRPVISITVGDVESFSESTLPGRAKAREEADLAFEVSGKLIERPVIRAAHRTLERAGRGTTS